MKLIVNIDYGTLLLGFLIMFSLHVLAIMINILITKGKEGLTSGRFKLYGIAAFFGVLCNIVEFIFQYSIKYNFICLIEIIAGLWVLYKIYSLKNSGEPSWYTGDEMEETPNPFCSTVGATFCIMVSYTFPTVAAIGMAIIFALAQSLTEIDKYKFIRIVPMSVINILEIITASILVRLAYKCSILKALFLISVIGLIFNILMGALNDYIFDRITKGKFLQE